MKCIGAGVLAKGPKDVVFAPNGDLLVADCSNRRVCAFSATGKVLRRWGLPVDEDDPDDASNFMYPSVLALVDTRLVVLDRSNLCQRVHVFE